MFGLFKRKKTDRYCFIFQISYTLASGKVFSIDPVRIGIAAGSKEQAERKIQRFVRSKITVKIIENNSSKNEIISKKKLHL